MSAVPIDLIMWALATQAKEVCIYTHKHMLSLTHALSLCQDEPRAPVMDAAKLEEFLAAEAVPREHRVFCEWISGKVIS